MNQLDQYVLAAKAILFNAKRAAPLLAMLTTKTGAVNAVHVVMSVIEKRKPIPPSISQELAVTIFKLIVELAQDATKTKVPPKLVSDVTQMLKTEVSKQQPMQPQRRPGLINQGA